MDLNEGPLFKAVTLPAMLSLAVLLCSEVFLSMQLISSIWTELETKSDKNSTPLSTILHLQSHPKHVCSLARIPGT